MGSVHVVRGQYKAYGQDLNITKGTVSFVGPLSRPNLNIRAVRNLSPVGAGVEVLGNLENPRVTPRYQRTDERKKTNSPG